jgi:hypothetical protein
MFNPFEEVFPRRLRSRKRGSQECGEKEAPEAPETQEELDARLEARLQRTKELLSPKPKRRKK